MTTTSLHPARARRAGPRRRASRGIVLVMALIALGLLLISAVAIIRSFDTSTLLAGNLAFKRDLVNQAERGVSAVRRLLDQGALASEALRNAHQPALNYAASKLPSNGDGIPLVLLSDRRFKAEGLGAADIVDPATRVSLRYVIDRQCAAAGAFDEARCVSTPGSADKGGSSWLKKPGADARPVYRVSLRVTGPQGTQAYFQTTFAD